MPAIESTYDVFVSHKSEHKPWVEWGSSRALQSCKRSVSLDHWNLIPGESWLEGLHRGLECSRSAVLVATPEVVNSGWVRQEYAALQRRRQSASGFRLIPIVFGDIPNLPFLKDLQAVDFRYASAALPPIGLSLFHRSQWPDAIKFISELWKVYWSRAEKAA